MNAMQASHDAELERRHTAAHAIVEAEFTSHALAAKYASTLTGTAIGLHGSHTAAEIRSVASRASRLLPYYDALWGDPNKAFSFTWNGFERLQKALAAGSGAIVVTAHFGPYRWLAPQLLAQGMPLTLLVDEAFKRVLDDDVANRVQKVYAQFGTDRFTTVNSGSPQALWQMARALKQGRVVVTFADGNSGIEGKAAENGCLLLPFLGQTIRARPGIAALSQVSGAPLIPVLACQDGSAGVFEVYEAIAQAQDEERLAFRRRATEALFTWLETAIVRAPETWEEWWLLPAWLAGKMTVSTKRTARPDFRLTLPGLARRRLALADNSVFSIDDGQERQVLDLARGDKESGSELYSLVSSSEHGEWARQWLDQQVNPIAARALLEREVRTGRIMLVHDRARLPIPDDDDRN